MANQYRLVSRKGDQKLYICVVGSQTIITAESNKAKLFWDYKVAEDFASYFNVFESKKTPYGYFFPEEIDGVI